MRQVGRVLGSFGAHLGCPVQPNGPIEEDKKQEVGDGVEAHGVDAWAVLSEQTESMRLGNTDVEILSDLLIVLLQAHQQTTNWIGNTIGLMLTDERFAITLSGGRASVGDALTEVLEAGPTALSNLQLALSVFLNGDLKCAQRLIAGKESKIGQKKPPRLVAAQMTTRNRLTMK